MTVSSLFCTAGSVRAGRPDGASEVLLPNTSHYDRVYLGQPKSPQDLKELVPCPSLDPKLLATKGLGDMFGFSGRGLWNKLADTLLCFKPVINKVTLGPPSIIAQTVTLLLMLAELSFTGLSGLP